MESYHVGVAAEAFAAALLAHAGCDISVQYGANQPGYDLVAVRGKGMIKVSVKGSQDRGWGLFQNYKRKGVGYHEAVRRWASAQDGDTVYCFVQFAGVKLGECPRVYLASIQDIVDHMRTVRNGHGHTILWEKHRYKSGIAAGVTDRIPDAWFFSLERVAHFLPDDQE